MTLSLTSRISLSLPTSRRGRNTVGLEFGASRPCSEMLTRHYRPHDDVVANDTRDRGAVSAALALHPTKARTC